MNKFNRRYALKTLSGIAASALPGTAARAVELFVSPSGSDANPGSRSKPLKTFLGAQSAARRVKSKAAVTVWFRAGVYYLPDTFAFTAQDSGTQAYPVTYAAFAKRR